MECSFCGVEVRRGTGLIYVSKSGKALYFCSGKCEKNMLKLGRNVRKVRWTKTYLEEKKARLKLIGHETKETKLESKVVVGTETKEVVEAKPEEEKLKETKKESKKTRKKK